MKVAVTAGAGDMDAAVDGRFGRAPWLMVVDTDSGRCEAVDNAAHASAPGGAGIRSAQTVAECGAAVVLTGHCGPKAFSALQAAGVQVITGVSGSVRQAVEQFRQGKLTPASGPDA